MILLVIACFYLAGLNLWLEFKSWFNERYERKREKKATKQSEDGLDERGIPSFVGRSKYNLQEEKLKREQQRKEREEKKEEENKKDNKRRPENQFYENQNTYKQVALDELDKHSLVNNQSVSSEEDIKLDFGYSPQNAVLASGQSATLDEFELLAKSLQGQAITQIQKKEAATIIMKLDGTFIYDQFLNQIQGAEDRASAILRGMADEIAMFEA